MDTTVDSSVALRHYGTEGSLHYAVEPTVKLYPTAETTVESTVKSTTESTEEPTMKEYYITQ